MSSLHRCPMGAGGEPPAEETEPAQADMALPTVATDGDQRSMPQQKEADETQTVDREDTSPPGLGEADQSFPADDLEVGGGQPAGSQISALQMVQAVLLILAVAGGLTAAYFRKKVR